LILFRFGDIGGNVAYTIFTRKVPRVGTPSVTLSSYGRIQFNKPATARLEKEAVEYVLLLWDADERKVGVRAIGKKDPRAYRVAYGVKGNGAGLSTKTFFDHIRLNYSESRSIPVQTSDGDIILEFQIPEEFFLESGQPRLVRGASTKQKMA
jgi:hypothetical protein